MNFNLFQNSLRFSAMSTDVLIKTRSSKKNIETAMNSIVEIETKLNAYSNSSELSLINEKAHIENIVVSDITKDVLNLSIDAAKITDGLFDPTIGILTQKTYGFGTKSMQIPSTDKLKNAKKKVNYKNIEINENSVSLKEDGMALDFGAIAKGYAAQYAIETLKKLGAPSALVSVGGEIVCYGKSFKIAISHPRRKSHLAIITTQKEQTTISTSGDYERYITDYNTHHILNPKSAVQNNDYASLTLISTIHNAGTLDAFTTAMFNMQSKELKEFAQSENLGVLMFTKDEEISISSSFMKNSKGIFII